MPGLKPPRRAQSTHVSRNPLTHFILLILVDKCISFPTPLYNLPSGHVLVYSLNCYIMERNSYRPRSGCNYDALIWIIKTNAIHTRDVSHNPTTHLNPLHLVDGCISFSPPSDHLPSDHVLVHPLNCYRILVSHRRLITSSMPGFKPWKRALSIHVYHNPPTHLILLVSEKN